MKFKWYHFILIAIAVIFVAGVSYYSINLIDNKTSSSESTADQGTKSQEKKTSDKKESAEEKTSSQDKTTSKAPTSTEKKEANQAEGQTSTEAKTETFDENKVKALVVDHKTSSSKRMVKYLKKAGFKVKRVESLLSYDVADYDTLVIPGGHNITPEVYGAERDEHTYGTDLEIDQLQIAAIKDFAEAEKPVLGVCRGCQVVNVAFGGTINQHIPGWHKKYREVNIDPSSWLYSMLGDSANVYHYHHQCVEEPGEGLIPTMWDAEDGHIEGIEHESLPVYGIQWHPDSMGDEGVKVFVEYKKLVTDYYKNIYQKDENE